MNFNNFQKAVYQASRYPEKGQNTKQARLLDHLRTLVTNFAQDLRDNSYYCVSEEFKPELAKLVQVLTLLAHEKGTNLVDTLKTDDIIPTTWQGFERMVDDSFELDYEIVLDLLLKLNLFFETEEPGLLKDITTICFSIISYDLITDVEKFWEFVEKTPYNGR